MDDTKEAVTKGMFLEGMDSLARLVNAGFINIKKRIATKEDLSELMHRIEGLEKEMRGMHQNFDTVFIELREIRREIKENNTSVDVTKLQIRVSKLEKKVFKT